MYHARKYGSMCYCLDNSNDSIVFLSDNNTIEYIKEVYSNNQIFTKIFHKKACGLCSIKEMYDIGITTVKVVGRADDEMSVIQDVINIRKYIDACKNDRNILEINKNIYENCWYGLNCYYHKL